MNTLTGDRVFVYAHTKTHNASETDINKAHTQIQTCIHSLTNQRKPHTNRDIYNGVGVHTHKHGYKQNRPANAHTRPQSKHTHTVYEREKGRG